MRGKRTHGFPEGNATLMLAGTRDKPLVLILMLSHEQIPQDATTEQRMISAAVFATLNEAWDKFKTENGL